MVRRHADLLLQSRAPAGRTGRPAPRRAGQPLTEQQPCRGTIEKRGGRTINADALGPIAARVSASAADYSDDLLVRRARPTSIAAIDGGSSLRLIGPDVTIAAIVNPLSVCDALVFTMRGPLCGL